MPDQKLRLVSLAVLGGALRGRRYDPEEVVTEILVGSDPDCHLVVDLPGVSPIHARVWADLDESFVHDTRAPRGVYVNDVRVEGQARIGKGDVLWLGPPEESDSVCIQCRFEPWVEVLPASVADEVPAPEAPVEVAEAAVLEEAPPGTPSDDPFYVGEGPGSGLPAAAAQTSATDDFWVAEAPPADGEAIVEAEPAPLEPPPPPLPPLDLPPPAPLAPRPEPLAPRPPGPAAKPSPPPAAPEPPVTPEGPPAPLDEPAPAPPTPAPRARPAAAPTRRPAASAPRAPTARRPPSARPAHRPSRGRPDWLRPVGLGLAGLVVVTGLVLGALRFLGGTVTLVSIEPARVRVGQPATLTGSGFSPRPAGNTVLFDGREAKVLQASRERLEVEVPEVVAESGSEQRVDVVVRTGFRTSGAVGVAVFQGPRLHGLSPEAALPGEEVLLAGAGWGIGATVRFGTAPAQVLEVEPTRIRVLVPEAAGTPGTEAPVVVTAGPAESNPAPFVVGHLPVVSGVSPASAAAGDSVTVSGRGFQTDPLRNDVRVGGVPALVVSASPDTLVVSVPRTGPGEPSRALEVRVPGSQNVGQAVLQVAPAADPVEFRFVVEPFTAAPGRPHAVVATGLGPTFVLAASGGRTAAERAVEAVRRLNGVAPQLRTTVGLNIEARGLEASPVLALAGSPEPLVEVTEEDAAAYNEDWTGLRGRGGSVSRARLARWWEALARDLVLLTVRGEKPRFAAALAPEGRVLAQVFDAAQRTGRPGVPRQVVDEARPALRDGLRLLALRVPASVTASVTTTGGAAPGPAVAAATPAPARLQLEGTWGGSQVEQGQRQYISAAFRRGGGTISYEGGLTLTVPLLTVEQTRRDQVRFSIQMRGGLRHYAGKWDGEAINGTISSDAAGRNVVGTFVLRRR